MADVIVKGNSYVDIDMAAGVQALYEILTLQAKEVYVHGSDVYAKSVTSAVKKYIVPIPEKAIDNGDEIYLVDVSSVEYLENNCGYPLDQVVEIFDHHFESEKYWREKLGSAARIEHVGAAATLVAEYAKEKEVWSLITDDTKVLLAAAIISNSQNFKVSMTTDRDKVIYREISQELNFAEKWPEEYLLSVQEEIGQDVSGALKSDTKTKVPFGDKTFGIAQLEMWDTEKFLQTHQKEVLDFLDNDSSDISFFMSASISQDKTYLLANDSASEQFLSELLDTNFDNQVAILDRIFIRKEMVKKILDS